MGCFSFICTFTTPPRSPRASPTSASWMILGPVVDALSGPHPVLACFSAANWRKKGFVWLASYSPSWGQGKDSSRAGTWREKLKQRLCKIIATSLLSLVFSTTFYPIAQAHLPRNGTTHSSLDTPTLASNQENVSQTCLKASQMKASFKLKIFPGMSWSVLSWKTYYNTHTHTHNLKLYVSSVFFWS